ncbi:MAG TPA: DNA-processing protein DprA [Solirubrobacteraceae bacterium]|jgi:predicted Rossmann fold nucleotide-binding protein DprA/Smf involved in DNA uptake|nr:DNA-processing protein DprA [Solirubrobacteraceae bacterium]
MACPECHRHSTLLAALAPAIERTTPLTRQSLLPLLALKNDEQLRHAAKTANPRKLPHRAEPPPATNNAPQATCRHDHAYPLALAQLDSAPAVLHTTCDTDRLTQLLAGPTVALIGDRHHTGYGHQATFALACDLATAGVTLISGLHQGLDGIAHHGALHAGGHTIAVTGSAPEIPYPRQLEHLHRRIATCGAIVSELPVDFASRRWIGRVHWEDQGWPLDLCVLPGFYLARPSGSRP